MAGLMGSTAAIFYSYDAKESENPNIQAMGATKTGTTYAQTTRRARYSSGGYTLGHEVYSLNQSDDVDTDVPYPNNDFGLFTAFDASVKLTAGGAGAPITHALMITGLGSKHAYYNGISIGGSAFRINNNTQGAAGTVAVNLVTQRTATGFAEIAFKYRTNHWHHYFLEPAKVATSNFRVINPTGSAAVSIEASTGSGDYPTLNFKKGVINTPGAGPSGGTQLATITSQISFMEIKSEAGFIRITPMDTANGVNYTFSTLRLAPAVAADGVPFLGAANQRFNTLYTVNSPIVGSDERIKTQIEAIPDAVLDAWGEVEFARYKMVDAVVAKGPDGARWHTGAVAQRVMEAFSRHGVDAKRYGLLCWDTWQAKEEQRFPVRFKVKEAVYEQIIFKPERKEIKRIVIQDAVYERIIVREEYVDEAGKIVPAQYRNGALLEEPVYEDQEYIVPAEYIDGELLEPEVFEVRETIIPAIEAGELFGIRYEEALALEAAYQRRRADRADARMDALEARMAALEATRGI